MKSITKIRRTAFASLLWMVICSFWASPAQSDLSSENRVSIGVLAFRGSEEAFERWSATADYLEWSIGGYRFEMVPLSLEKMKQAVSNDEVDFVLTNTGNYVDLEARYGVTRIATLRSPTSVLAGNVFGAIIFTRADRDDIQSLEDLKGKSFMGVEKNGFGGFQMAWRELIKNGLDPFNDFSSLTFSGFPQDQSAYRVLEGKVDAATFRTGTLENMQAEGAIDIKDFKVLNSQQHPGFPFAVSTQLYPEWPFSRTKKTSEELAQKVAIALLSMPANSPAAEKGHYGGWTVPLDYQPVHELFRELRIGPYEEIGQITFMDVLKQYGHWITLATVAILITIAWATWIEVLVKRRTTELSTANRELERQIAERIRAEEDAQLRQAELAHVDRLNTMGEMASGFAHELNQPLSAIINYARGCIRRIEKRKCDNAMILETLDRVTQQATRAGEIIKRIRAFVRKEEPTRIGADINQLIKEALAFVKGDVEGHGISILQQLQTNLPPVSIDPIQVEQVILNLFRNAVESMKEDEPGDHRLSVTTRWEDSDEITVSVSDTGPGFGEAAETMFDPFVSSKTNGLGLGLSISRTIVEAHGGRLKIEKLDDSGAGATLTFTLPIDDTAEGRE